MIRLKHFVLLFAFLCVQPSFAGRGEGRGQGRFLKDLDLSKDQKEKLQKLREGKREEMKSLREKMKAAHEKLREALKSDASESSLKSLHGEVLNLRSELATKRFSNMLEIRSVLTPEQRKKFSEMHEKKMKEHGGFGRRHGHGEDDEDEEEEE